MKAHSVSSTFTHKFVYLLIYMLSVQGKNLENENLPTGKNTSSLRYENRTQVIYKVGAESRLRLPHSWFIIPVRCPFTSLIKSLAIVDNSLMIEDVLKQNTTPRLILAPRFWCKSTNLDMLAFFFNQSVNEVGEKLPKNSSAAYHYFKNGEIFVNKKVERFNKKPLISAENDAIERHLGEYAVIYINLTDIDVGLYKRNGIEVTIHERNDTGVRFEVDYQSFLKSFEKRIVSIFKQYEYLEKVLLKSIKNKHETSKEFDKISLQKYLSTGTVLDKNDLINSLLFLTRIIKNYTSTEVIILCDEYDAPYTALYYNSEINGRHVDTRLQIDPIKEFMKSFMAATFKENKFYKRAILAGVNKINFDIRTVISNLYADTEDDFTPYHGFSYKDLNELLELRGIANPPDDEVQKRYHQKARFNPWSVINFMGNQELSMLWPSH